jgi:hypothetical protein
MISIHTSVDLDGFAVEVSLSSELDSKDVAAVKAVVTGPGALFAVEPPAEGSQEFPNIHDLAAGMTDAAAKAIRQLLGSASGEESARG